MENLKTTVENKTEMALTFRNYIRCEKNYFGNEEMLVPAGGVKRIRSGNFIWPKCTFGFWSLDVFVLNGKQTLVVLNPDEFVENKGKQLVLEMVDGRLRYEFVDPIHKTPLSHRIWDALDLIVDLIHMFRNEEEHPHSQNTMIHNKTEIQLTFIDFYKSGPTSGYYGHEKIAVPALGRMTFCFGNYLRESLNWAFEDPEIHVFRGQEYIRGEPLLIMNHCDFQANKGKELIMDLQDGHLRYYFLDTLVQQIRRGLSVRSFAVLKKMQDAWFVFSWKIASLWSGASCLVWLLVFTLLFFFALAFA